MVDKKTDEEKAPAPPAAPRRGPGHRGADMRDTMAEMAERAQLISQEAGSKVASAMKDVISAAAGLAGFAIESARDLVQYMVRRGQMTQEEADKLIREAEESFAKKPGSEERQAGKEKEITSAANRGDARARRQGANSPRLCRRLDRRAAVLRARGRRGLQHRDYAVCHRDGFPGRSRWHPLAGIR